MPRRRFYCLRGLRKRLGKYCGTQRDLRKRLGKCCGTCATCTNVSANAVGLARPAQTSWQMLRDLRSLRKRLGKYRGTCATCANVSANAAGPSATCANVSANTSRLARPAQTLRQIPWDLRSLRKRFGKCRGTCGSTLAPSEKPNERTPLDVPLISLWFYS